MLRSRLILLLALAAGLAGYVLYRSNLDSRLGIADVLRETKSVEAASGIAMDNSEARSADPGPRSATRLAALPKPNYSSNQFLIEAASKSSDWRSIAVRALSNPQPGGAFAAWYMATECSRNYGAILAHAESSLASDVSNQGTVGVVRLEAIELLRTRCGQFAANEAGEIAERVLFQDGAFAADPLVNALKAHRHALRVRSPTERRQAYEALVALGSPSVLGVQGLMSGLLAFGGRDKGAGAMYVDGNYYLPADGNRYGAIALAIQLMPCLGAETCQLEIGLLHQCALTGRLCAGSRDEILNQYTRDAMGDAAVDVSPMDLARRLRANVVAKNLKAFFPS